MAMQTAAVGMQRENCKQQSLHLVVYHIAYAIQILFCSCTLPALPEMLHHYSSNIFRDFYEDILLSVLFSERSRQCKDMCAFPLGILKRPAHS